MKTLRLFVYALLTNLLLLYACGNDDSNENISIPEDNKSGITIDSSIISDGLSFSNLQGEQTVSFTTSEDWTLSIASTTSGVSWCTASATSGRKGNTSIKFAVTENTSYDSRIVSVTIKSGAETKTFSISQKCVDALLITTNKYDLSQEGGNINIEVKANIDYTMEISENSKDWINEISNRALSNYKHTFNIAMNENVQKREGEILFKSGDKAETVKVYQSGGAIILLSQNEYLISSQRDTISIDIKSNIDFEVQVPNVDWIHDMTSTRGLSSHTLSYVIDANEQTENRFSQIIFYDKNSDIKDTLKIKQFHSGYLQINTESTGNIPSIINKDSKYKITELIVKGNINGTDIQFLREMSGNDANGNYTDGKLQILDISECNIKEGGNPYIFSKTTKDNFIGSYMFQGCISLKELHLPKDVTEIEDFAFYNASNLKKITIPSSISKLGLSIIEGCASLDSLTIPHNVKEWNKLGKSGVNTIIIENGVSYIPREAFFACDELKTLIIPKSVTYINNAFSYGGLKEIYIDDLNQWLNYNWYNPNYPFEASGRGFVNGEIVRDTGFNEMGKLYINGNLLTNLSLPNNIEIVPAYAFHGCSSIETIEIPNNIIEIEQSAFAGTQIEEISIPNSVHKMGDAIFRSCYNLKKVNLPNNITEFPGGFLADCSSLTEFTIPDYIERLGSGVFSCCDNLKTVKLSQKLTSIPSNAFYACKQLDIIEIPNSVSSIFDYSFAYCKSLKSISIPENVKFIESYAFEATPLEKVYCYAQTPPTISSHHVFDKATNLILYVPKNCKDAYKSSKWNMYFDKIYEIEK